ncbi:hypothetical protein Leryth_018998 [Lithospermum erythrorhizon]|uniref:Oxidoreductase n=1 Tax=Lithospermum erythrorhizon TaxID=34254 RepID=A0AAV3R1K8_LITER|nr:hypothetical protein Leryth_018998 [Lithospermum erythrorhizon]
MEQAAEVVEVTAKGWAAMEPTTILSPYAYTLRDVGSEDVLLKVICCGICHSDIHFTKNDIGLTTYPLVPGHEVVGEVVKVGFNVSKFNVGDLVGIGFLCGSCQECYLCKSDREQYCDNRIFTCLGKYPDGKPAHGGFSSAMVLDHRLLARIPKGMKAEQAAPLLCAGVTAYSALINLGLNKPGLRGGILGLGGIGHMGVIIAKAMGHHVTVLSSSDKKKQEALDDLGADVFIVTSDTTQMLESANSLDYILDTLPVVHSLDPHLNLLKADGKLIMLGVINTPLQFLTVPLFTKRISIVGSFMGSTKEMEELLNFFQEKGLASKLEMVKMNELNTAFERLQKNDVRYRFVVDVAGSNPDS